MEEEVQVFDQIGHALGHMEAPEVNEGFWRLFDGAGSEAELASKKWDVIIKGWSSPDPARMREAVSTFLARQGLAQPAAESDGRSFALAAAATLETHQEQARPAWIRMIARLRDRLRGPQQ